MSLSFLNSLPSHGVPMTIPEIVCAVADMDGKSVRVVGRVDHYDPSRSIAILTEPNISSITSTNMKLTINTSLTDASDYRLGSQIMLIGELENSQDTEAGYVLKARVSRCVERLDYALYCKAIDVWRTYDSAER